MVLAERRLVKPSHGERDNDCDDYNVDDDINNGNGDINNVNDDNDDINNVNNDNDDNDNVRNTFKTPRRRKSPLRGGGWGVPLLSVNFFSVRFLGTDRPLRGGGDTPLSVNFFPLTFWVKNSVFWVKNTKKCRLRQKILDFASVKGGGVPPLSVR